MPLSDLRRMCMNLLHPAEEHSIQAGHLAAVHRSKQFNKARGSSLRSSGDTSEPLTDQRRSNSERLFKVSPPGTEACSLFNVQTRSFSGTKKVSGSAAFRQRSRKTRQIHRNCENQGGETVHLESADCASFQNHHLYECKNTKILARSRRP